MKKRLNLNNIWFVDQFPTTSLVIDFNRPDLAQNEIVKLLEENENNSPVGKQMYNVYFGGVFTIKNGEFSKEFPICVKDKLKDLEDGEYTLEF
jgi:hypothetical protein